MTREEARKAAEVMMAYAEGREVEYYDEVHECWESGDYIFFNWYDTKYRVKPETKYRPFKDMEECWQEMLKHQPFGWVKSKGKGYFHLIGLVQWSSELEDVMITFATSEQLARSSCSLFDDFTFVDGTPFGVNEE